MESNLALGNDCDITRITYVGSVGSTYGVLRFDVQPDTEDIGAHFNTGEAGYDLTLYVQTNETNVQSAVASGMLGGLSTGNSWGDIDSPSTVESLLPSKSDGVSLMIGLGRLDSWTAWSE